MFCFPSKKNTYLYSPVDGIQIPIEKVNDPVFSTKMMGNGVAFQFDGDTIYLPCHGKIKLIAPTLHAIGMTLSNGIEILIHVGLDTVHLNGQGFTVLCKEGDNVVVNTPLLKIDRKVMEKENIDLTTVMIILDDKQIHYSINYQTNVKKGVSKVIIIK